MTRVVRGRADGIGEDRAVTRALVEDVVETGEPVVRAWTPHRQVAFGRRDARADGYDRARTAAEERGFPAHERRVGGRAVAYTGRTVAFCRIEPLADIREGMTARYDAALGDLRGALADLGAPLERGEPDEAFCPGSHSLSADGKVIGLAQRVRRGAATVGGICLVADRGPVAAVLDPVYAALEVPFDPASVGSVARAGGPDDPDRVTRAIERALVAGIDDGGGEGSAAADGPTVERVE